MDDVAAEPGSVLNELGGFPVKEIKFRREMEKLRNGQQRDITLEVERDRAALIQQTIKQLNTQYNRRSSAGGKLLIDGVQLAESAGYLVIHVLILTCFIVGQRASYR